MNKNKAANIEEEFTTLLEDHLLNFSSAKQNRILDSVEAAIAVYNRHLETLPTAERKVS